jgi:hypothetical protein
MSPRTISIDGRQVNLQSVIFSSLVVVASPAAAAETIICSVTVPAIDADQTVYLWAWAAYTVGTNGTAGRLRVRRDNVAGTTTADTGALTVTAPNLVTAQLVETDVPGAVQNQIYVTTLTITAGSAASTVSATTLVAAVI